MNFSTGSVNLTARGRSCRKKNQLGLIVVHVWKNARTWDDMGRKCDLAYYLGFIWIFTILWLGSGLSLVICCICSIVNSASVPVHGKCAEKCFKTLTLLVEDHVSWLSWDPKTGFLAEHCIPLLLANKQYIKLPNEVCPVSPTFCSFPTASFE